MRYQLPSDPSILNENRLDIQVDGVEEATHAQILDTLLQKASRCLNPTNIATLLPDLIEELAYITHENGSLNTDGLRNHLAEQTNLVPGATASLRIVSAARTLSKCFPCHALETLQKDGDYREYTGAQVDALLAHQFLGTLYKSEGTDWGFPCFTDWFAAEPRHPRAVDGYLSTIIDHFAQGGYDANRLFSFFLQTADSMPGPSQRCNEIPRIELRSTPEESEPSDSSEEPFVLVAAHSQPGPGATGTQEERIQSAAQALSISALVCPVLADNAAVVTNAFPIHAEWKGHNRTARLNKLFEAEKRPRRYYILADALALDEMEEDEVGLSKDLRADRVEREVRKLYAAFLGATKMRVAGGMITGGSIGKGEPCVIEAGAWGCGAFGGNVVVKTICMMIAAGLTGVRVRLTLLESREQEIGLVRLLMEKQHTTAELWRMATTTRHLPDLIQHLQS